jgi:hypothetical protein
MSVSHEVCNLPASLLQKNLGCAFNTGNDAQHKPKQLFLVRDPVARAISIYYFWGYLFERKKKNSNRRNHRFFEFHGNISTPPSLKIAMDFTRKLPLREGMPGPSKMWSAISNSRGTAVKLIKSDDLMTLIVERFDESLVVAAHYLGWDYSDVVYMKQRKNRSHPKASSWPADSINELKIAVTERGEVAVYNTADAKLDERIETLTKNGFNITSEVNKLQILRAKVTDLCYKQTYLDKYYNWMENLGYAAHLIGRENRHEDVDADLAYTAFHLNMDIIYSFEVCATCEAKRIHTVRASEDPNSPYYEPNCPPPAPPSHH